MPRLLRDQVVVITGASTGIGREAALEFAARGARVVLAARNAEALNTVAADIRAQGGQALVVPTDVTDMAAVERLAEAAVERFGRIDTWVNNAAVSFYATFEQATIEEMRRQMDVTYWGNVHGFKAALPHLRQGGGGVLISVASALADFAVPLQGTYCAAKHALGQRDTRERHVSLTPEGQRAYERHFMGFVDDMRARFDVLEPYEQDFLIALLKKLKSAFT